VKSDDNPNLSIDNSEQRLTNMNTYVLNESENEESEIEEELLVESWGRKPKSDFSVPPKLSSTKIKQAQSPASLFNTLNRRKK
jgi:hypothetical protein